MSSSKLKDQFLDNILYKYGLSNDDLQVKRSISRRPHAVHISPLHYFAMRHHRSMVQWLNDHCPDINKANINELLHLAIEDGRGDIVECLLARGADVNYTNENGDTPLHAAARPPEPTRDVQTRTLVITEALLSRGADVVRVNSTGDAPLHVASKNGHGALVEALLARGADVHTVNLNGDSPLTLAAFFGFCPIVEALLSHGAEANVERNELKLKREKLRAWSWVVIIHIFHSHMPSMRQIRAPSEAFAPLHSAAENGHAAIVETLLRRGADVNLSNVCECTALHHAAGTRGNIGVVKALVEQGAVINVSDDHGNTPLHCAALWGDIEIVEYLIQNGALVWTRNSYGDTPLDTANVRGRNDTAEILKPYYD